MSEVKSDGILRSSCSLLLPSAEATQLIRTMLSCLTASASLADKTGDKVGCHTASLAIEAAITI